MIFRAIFWIGLVAILMPHEPDLGLGRPAAITSPLAGEIAGWTKANVDPNLKDPANLCRYNVHACATTLSLLDSFRDAAVHSLAQVKADIERNGRAHLKGAGG